MIKCVKMYSNNYRGTFYGKANTTANYLNARRKRIRKYKKQIKEDKEIEEEISNRNTANTTTTE